jgi:hypothetical protein
MLHRGARAAVEFAGSEAFAEGKGPALARPVLTVDGRELAIGAGTLVWERALGWLPTFTGALDDLVLRGTVFAPYGRDTDTAGAVYAIAIENRTDRELAIGVALEGTLGSRQLRVRSPRPFDDAHRIVRGADDVVLLSGSSLPGLVALAIGADGEAEVEVRDGEPPSYAIRRALRVPPRGHAEVAFYLAAGPERDGAHATVDVMRRRGWRELLGGTRDALRALEQSTGNEALDRLLNRNLLLAYFYAVGRALDDAHYYLVRTRAPWHSSGVTTREWEALMWTIPAVQLADTALARELLLRACELHGYAPGHGARYLDGTLFEPGFSLEGAAAYAIAIDRYIRDSGDDQIVDEPVLADTLYVSSDDLAARRNERVPLYSTEVSSAGRPAALPYTLHGNATVAQALEILRRTLDEQTSRDVEDPDAVRAAITRHFARESGGKTVYASAVDLAGNAIVEDDPLASVLWLPMYETVDRSESAYRRTVRALDTTPHWLALQCARLVGPDSSSVMQWLRRAPLDNGFAAEEIDSEGRAVGNGADGALAGLLAYSLWYAVHALGVHA